MFAYNDTFLLKEYYLKEISAQRNLGHDVMMYFRQVAEKAGTLPSDCPTRENIPDGNSPTLEDIPDRYNPTLEDIPDGNSPTREDIADEVRR